jgi:hypothetical protein
MDNDVIAGIYKITNNVNKKCYIGQSKDIYNRWKTHKQKMYQDDSAFHCALRTVGIENFTWEILESELFDEETRNEREKYWIQYYHSLITENGYNSTRGGSANAGCLNLQKKVLQYDIEGNLLQEYESLSEASRQTGIFVSNLIECCQSEGKILAKKTMWFYYQENYSKRIKPYKRSNAKEVEQYSLQGKYIQTFSSLHAAASAIGCTEEGIQSCTSHKTQTAYGFIWKLKEDPTIIVPYVNKKFKQVLKINKKTKEIVAEYKSIKEAAEKNLKDQSSMSKWCHHKRIPIGDYYYVFKEEYINGN